MAKAMLHTRAEVVRKGIKAEEGILDAVVGSSNVLDRLGDRIDQAGWKLQNYKKSNPVILWGHNQKEERPPIGRALKVWVQDKGEKAAKLMFKVQFDLQDNFAKEIFRKVKDGFINTVSVGFLPIEWEELDKKKKSGPCNPFGGRKYTKQELLELSFVPVPANPEAVVAMKGMKDKRFAPVKLKDIYPQVKEKITDEAVEKPFPNFHACRLRDPGDFKKGSFKSISRKHKGKKYRVILGRLKGKTTLTEQSYRYGKDVWDKSSARTHCKDHKGTFEAATGASADREERVARDIAEGLIKGAKEELGMKLKLEKFDIKKIKLGEDKVEKELKEKKVKKKVKIKKKVKKVKAKKKLKKKEPKAEPKVETKGTIPFKDLGTLPESAPWDGPGEKAKAEVSDMKLICAWFDGEKPDVKGSYKLPHHKADGHKCVWRGTAAAMAALLGARGGAEIPDGDRKGVFNHLKKHYAQFKKTPPDFKSVENQVLRDFDEEIHALTLDREDRYTVRLIKKVLEKQAKERSTVKPVVKIRYTPERIESALQVLDSALSLLAEARRTEVKKKG